MTATDTPVRDDREISWPLEFQLDKPITVGQNAVQVLILREPTGQEVLKYNLLEGLSPEQFFPLVADLSATPPPVLMKISAANTLQLGTLLSRFFRWAAQPPAPSTTASV